MSSYLLLWLEGPLQAWGYDSKFGLRLTLPFPTRSGVMGLILSALGAGGEQKELLGRFRSLHHAVYAYSLPGIASSELVDFQVVGNGYDASSDWESKMIPKKRDGNAAVGGGSKLTFRHYLQDAAFAVIQEVPDDMAGMIEESLKAPVWPVFL